MNVQLVLVAPILGVDREAHNGPLSLDVFQFLRSIVQKLQNGFEKICLSSIQSSFMM